MLTSDILDPKKGGVKSNENWYTHHN